VLVRQTRVAVLLATYNGAGYVAEQVQSFARNDVRFTLYWLDDQSTDETRQVVVRTARAAGIDLVECHHEKKQGVPGAFFQLLEDVEADIYLFSDQDDIWQEGKIDAVVADLASDVASPTLCFSDPLVFYQDNLQLFRRRSRLLNIRHCDEQGSSLYVNSMLAVGNALAVTRPLRDLYLRHKEIARAHAIMHSTWMLLLASATGTYRALNNVPTTLFRQHGANVTAEFMKRRRGLSGLRTMWELQHMMRRYVARQARGFILAAATLPPSPKLERLLESAAPIAELRRRQSLRTLLRLWLQGSVMLRDRPVIWLIASCLLCDAKRRQPVCAAEPATLLTPGGGS
jgi:glycosyltransferase involved in cell wall biosynthesis